MYGVHSKKITVPAKGSDGSRRRGPPLGESGHGLIGYVGLSRDEAVTAAVHLQRDVGLMQTNVDVLDQYTLYLQKAASRIIDNCLGPSKYPASEVETGTLGPRVSRAAKQMESMGLWRPSMDPLQLH